MEAVPGHVTMENPNTKSIGISLRAGAMGLFPTLSFIMMGLALRF